MSMLPLLNFAVVFDMKKTWYLTMYILYTSLGFVIVTVFDACRYGIYICRKGLTDRRIMNRENGSQPSLSLAYVHKLSVPCYPFVF